MAKYKPYDLTKAKMMPLSYADQISEGSFEYALNDIVESHLDLSVVDARYSNDGIRSTNHVPDGSGIRLVARAA